MVYSVCFLSFAEGVVNWGRPRITSSKAGVHSDFWRLSGREDGRGGGGSPLESESE